MQPHWIQENVIFQKCIHSQTFATGQHILQQLEDVLSELFLKVTAREDNNRLSLGSKTTGEDTRGYCFWNKTQLSACTVEFSYYSISITSSMHVPAYKEVSSIDIYPSSSSIRSLTTPVEQLTPRPESNEQTRASPAHFLQVRVTSLRNYLICRPN
jgi:hypothetical protein